MQQDKMYFRVNGLGGMRHTAESYHALEYLCLALNQSVSNVIREAIGFQAYKYGLDETNNVTTQDCINHIRQHANEVVDEVSDSQVVRKCITNYATVQGLQSEYP